MYCIVSENNEKVSTAKGVNISVEFKEYESVLFNEKIIGHKMKRIQNKFTWNWYIWCLQSIFIKFWWQKIHFKWWNDNLSIYS